MNMKAVVVRPGQPSEITEIKTGLKALQDLVGGYIEAVCPFDDPVAIICNEEGKLTETLLNRALRDEDGHICDIIAGTFAVVGLGDENFCALTDELAEKYAEIFRVPEMFISAGDRICVIQMGEG